MKNLKQYAEDKPDPLEKYDPPPFEGFVPIFKGGFSFAHEFTGEHSFASIGDEKYIIGYDGSIVKTDEDLSEYRLSFDKYIFFDGDKQGVKTVFGETILPAEYSEITYLDDTILAVKDSKGTVFSGKTIIMSDIPLNYKLFTSSILHDENFNLFNLDLTPLKFREYDLITESINGFSVIFDGEYFGYVSDSGYLIEPEFVLFSEFNEYGYATVAGPDSAKTYIIDRLGNKVLSGPDNLEIVRFDGNYTIVRTAGSFSYGLTDKDFNFLTEQIFSDIADYKVYGDYIIEGTFKKSFYSIKEQAYVTKQYNEIIPFENSCFIVEDENGEFSVLDYDLKTMIGGCENITVYKSSIGIVKNGISYFYVPEK